MFLQSIYSLAHAFPGLLRSPWLVRALLFLPLLPALGLFVGACAKREAAPQPEPELPIARGDRVVVEATAAHFFEGKVLASEGQRLRVQTADGDDSVSVALGDAYRLPALPYVPRSGALAICNHQSTWLPCRIVRVELSQLTAVDASGSSFDLSADQVLAPSPLTALDLKRYFARSEADLEFKRHVQDAGEPQRPVGWHPSRHERVLAKVGADWFTAYVRGTEKDGVTVTFAGARAEALMPQSQLAAEPPSSFAAGLHRGDFVLVRPAMPSQPWLPRVVRSMNGTELKLADATGTIKTTSPREVVPLGAVALPSAP